MKRLIIVTLSVLTTAITFGQTTFGIKAGLNLATTKGFFLEPKAILAEHVGFYANTNVGKRMFFRPELLYTVKGYKFPAWGEFDEGTFNCNYIAIPILVGVRPMENASFSLGAEISYLWNAKYHFADSTGSNLQQFNKVDFSLAAGAAYRFFPRFSAELRYNYGFKDLLTIPYSDQSGNHTRTVGAHRVLQLSFNYQLTKTK